MPADMQTTNRYEHSLDSAIRPVRPSGISRRTREHPCDAPSDEGASLSRALSSRVRAPRRPGLHDHCGVSVKTSSEIESVARRPHRPLSPSWRRDRSHQETCCWSPIRSRTPRASLALPRTGSPRQPVKACLEAASASSHCRKERPVRRPDMAEPCGAARDPGRPFASVIAATPRALNPIPHRPRRSRALPVSRTRLPKEPLPGQFGWAYREI